MSGIKDNNFIFAGLVIILIEGKKLINSQIWEHTAYAIQEHVWTAIFVLDSDMIDDTLMNVLHKLWRMGIACQCVLSVLCLGWVILLFSSWYFNIDG